MWKMKPTVAIILRKTLNIESTLLSIDVKSMDEYSSNYLNHISENSIF